MTQIKSKEQTTGILLPAMKNRWRIILGNRHRISMQATKCELDMLHSTFTLYLEQPINLCQEMLDDIRSLSRGGSDYPVDMKLQLVDGDGETAGEVRGFAHLIEHKFILDYAEQEVATHVLRFEYIPSA